MEEGARFCQQCGVQSKTTPAPEGDAGVPARFAAEAAREASLAATDDQSAVVPPSERSDGESEVARRPARRGARVVVIAVIACAVLLAAAAGLWWWRSAGLGDAPEETMRAALGVPAADFVEAGTHAGPPGSGEVWAVYESKLDGAVEPSWVYVDDERRIRRVDNFSAAGIKPAASDSGALAAARKYVAAVEGPPLDGLRLRARAPGLQTGRPTTVVWQKRVGEVWVPTGVTVQVAAGGKIAGYLWVDTPVTVALEPGVTAKKAAMSVRRALRLPITPPPAAELEVLVIDPDGDGKVQQVLVWSLSFATKSSGDLPSALAVVDAQSGEALSAERTVLP